MFSPMELANLVMASSHAPSEEFCITWLMVIGLGCRLPDWAATGKKHLIGPTELRAVALARASGILSWTTKELSFSSTAQMFLPPASKARQRTSRGGRFCSALREQTARRRLRVIPEPSSILYCGLFQLFLCMARLRGTELSACSRDLSLATFE